MKYDSMGRDELVAELVKKDEMIAQLQGRLEASKEEHIKRNWGGKREGAGRRSSGNNKKVICIYCSTQIAECLRLLANHEVDTMSQAMKRFSVHEGMTAYLELRDFGKKDGRTLYVLEQEASYIKEAHRQAKEEGRFDLTYAQWKRDFEKNA